MLRQAFVLPFSAVASCHWVLAAVGYCDWLPAAPSVSNCHVVDDDDLDCQRSRQALLVGSIIASAAEMADSLNLRVKAWQANSPKPPCLDNGIAQLHQYGVEAMW